MDGGNKERFAINFLFKAGPYATEIGAKGFWEWGSEPIKIFMRYSGFRDGREMVENDERGGPPKSTRIEVNNAAVANLVKNGRRIASRMVAESLNIHKTVGLWILKEDLGKRKMCICFVPHSLTPEEREDRVTSCQDFIAMANAEISFDKIITGDETWCFVYDPETKRQVLNGFVGSPFGQRDWNSKGPSSRPCW